jgi:Uma2 family endonuclease
MDVQTRIGMPMDEFIRQYEEAPFELVDGERLPLGLQVAGQADVFNHIVEPLFLYERNKETHFLFHIPFVEVDAADRVVESRTPKIVIYETSRWLEYRQQPDWGDRPLCIVPDLCVEILAPNEKILDFEPKASRYLKDGVRIVWVINWWEKMMTVHTPTGITRLTITDTLDGGDVLPGFKLPLTDIFQP